MRDGLSSSFTSSFWSHSNANTFFRLVRVKFLLQECSVVGVGWSYSSIYVTLNLFLLSKVFWTCFLARQFIGICCWKSCEWMSWIEEEMKNERGGGAATWGPSEIWRVATGISMRSHGYSPCGIEKWPLGWFLILFHLRLVAFHHFFAQFRGNLFKHINRWFRCKKIKIEFYPHYSSKKGKILSHIQSLNFRLFTFAF